MAKDDARLQVVLEAKIDKLSEQLSKANRAIYASTGKMQRDIDANAKRVQRSYERDMAGSILRANDRISQSMRGLAGGLAAGFSVQKVVEYADAWTRGGNALASAGVEAEDLGRVQNLLVDAATRSLSSADAMTAFYARLTRATETLGLAESDRLKIAELVNKSFALSGATATEAAAGVLQLSQALASGILQGDELRSLRENAPEIARAIADEMGVTIGELKKLGAEGKISSEIIAKAILNAGDAIEGRFKTLTPTVGQALTVLNNEIGRYIGESDKGLSATDRMAEAIVKLAHNLDAIVPALTVLVGLIGGRFVLALTASASAMAANAIAAASMAAAQAALTASMVGTTPAAVAATGAIRGLSAAMAANPIGAAVVAVAALSAALIYLDNRYDDVKVAQRELTSTRAAAETAIDAYKAKLVEAAEKTGKEKEEALKLAAALREVAIARAADLRLLADKRVKEYEESFKVAAAAADRARRTEGQPTMGAGGFNVARMSNNLAAANALRDAQRDYNQALAALRAAKEQEDRIAALGRGEGISRPGRSTTPPTPTASAGPKGAAGPSEAELAAMREKLALDHQIDVARAAGDKSRIQALEDEVYLRRTIEELTRAGAQNAEATGRRQLELVQGARDLAEGQEQLNEFLTTSAAVVEAFEDMQRQTVEEILAAAEEQERALFESTRDGVLDGLYAASQGNFADYLANRLRQKVFESVADGIAEAMATGGAGGGFGGLLRKGASLLGLPGFAGGTNSASGGWAKINERGPEGVAYLPKGTKVIPNDVLRALTNLKAPARAVSPVIHSPTYNLQGAVLTNEMWAEIQAVDRRSQAGIAGLASAVRQGDRTLGGRLSERDLLRA